MIQGTTLKVNNTSRSLHVSGEELDHSPRFRSRRGWSTPPHLRERRRRRLETDKRRDSHKVRLICRLAGDWLWRGFDATRRVLTCQKTKCWLSTTYLVWYFLKYNWIVWETIIQCTTNFYQSSYLINFIYIIL